MVICIVAGARPNFVKIAPIVKELKRREIDFYLVNTGQHYDEKMAGIFFKELGIVAPDYDLGVGSGSHALQTAKIMIEFEKVLLEKKTELVVVVGDVNSTLACAITSKKLNTDVAHVEAGLRSFDMTMPEEVNRIVTDRLSDLLLIYSDDAKGHLLHEGTEEKKIKFVGNVMIDSLLSNMEKIDQSQILEKENLTPKKYSLVTLHRPSNVDNKETLSKLIETIINTVPEDIKIYFPIHPRTLAKLKEFDIYHNLEKKSNVIISGPQGYLDFQKLMKHAMFVLSDSGGVQEETTMYNTPCLTLRENTERPICIDVGTTQLVNLDNLKENILKVIEGKWKNGEIPKYWDGKAAERIVDELENHLKNKI